MRRAIPVVILVLLLLAIGFGVAEWSGPHQETVPPAPPATIDDPGVVPPDVPDAPAPNAADGATTPTQLATGQVEPPAAGRDASEPAAPLTGSAGADPSPAAGPTEPAVRRNPRDPPAPPPGATVGPGSRRPPMGPTGQWEKFPPEIPRGRAAVKIRILDSEGLPIPGAEAWLGPSDIKGDASVSYAHLRKLGKANAKGEITATLLPAGAAAIAGNLAGMLNGPRGLDARSAAAVTLQDDRTAEVELTLPISLASLARVTGIVSGPDGEPLGNVAVMVGYFRARTGKDGAFELAHVPPGSHILSFTRSGYRARGETIDLEEGAMAELDVTMEFRESGSVSLSGVVAGPAGEPVEGARIYVVVYGASSSGTVRSGITDAQGCYEMGSLPDRLRKSKVRIQASRTGYRAANEIFESGLRSGEVNLRLPVKLTKLTLTVLDAASSEPQTRCRFEATRSGDDRPSRSFSSRSETGVYETWIAAGKYGFLVESPDHEAHRAEVTVEEGGADLAYTARLVSGVETSTEVSLTVVVTSAATGEAVETAKVEVTDPETGEVLSRLESRRPGGVFTMPAPSGRRTIRVAAAGFEEWETDVDLDPDEAERKVEAGLTPR